MRESFNVVPIFERRANQAIRPFMVHADVGQIGRRVVWYDSPQPHGCIKVLVSWEAQVAVAGRDDMTTDEIFGLHAGDIDRQIALLITFKEPPRNGVWTLDAGDIVPIV